MYYIFRIIVLIFFSINLTGCGARINLSDQFDIFKFRKFTGDENNYSTQIASEYPLNEPYRLDTGDRVRITVFGHPSLTNRYEIDRQGNVALPLVGHVHARRATTAQLSKLIARQLQKKHLRAPSVSVEMDSYRPFFIYGEVNNGGQFPYVNGMTIQTAIAIAGGFTPRAQKTSFKLSRIIKSGSVINLTVPIDYRLRPGDTIVVSERFF